MYPGATPDHVQVTNGGSEANCVLLMRLVEPGDEIVLMTPNYMQVRGPRARRSARPSRPWRLRASTRTPDAGRADLDGAEHARHARHARDPALQSRTTRPAPGSTRDDARRDLPPRRRGRRLGRRRRDLPRRGARRRRHADGLGPLRARGRHERAVEGLRPARPADRLDRRAARSRRGPVGRPRLHDDRARRDQRSARAHRARAGAARGSCSRGRAASSARTTRSSGAGSSGRTASATSRRRPGPSRFVRHAHPIALVRADRAAARRSAASSSCPATSSTWTATSGSASDPIPTHLESALVTDRRVPRAPSAPMRADLALVGFGNVGRRFARLIEERPRLARARLRPRLPRRRDRHAAPRRASSRRRASTRSAQRRAASKAATR